MSHIGRSNREDNVFVGSGTFPSHVPLGAGALPQLVKEGRLTYSNVCHPARLSEADETAVEEKAGSSLKQREHVK